MTAVDNELLRRRQHETLVKLLAKFTTLFNRSTHEPFGQICTGQFTALWAFVALYHPLTQTHLVKCVRETSRLVAHGDRIFRVHLAQAKDAILVAIVILYLFRGACSAIVILYLFRGARRENTRRRRLPFPVGARIFNRLTLGGFLLLTRQNVRRHRRRWRWHPVLRARLH